MCNFMIRRKHIGPLLAFLGAQYAVRDLEEGFLETVDWDVEVFFILHEEIFWLSSPVVPDRP